MTDDMSAYRDVFLSESAEYLQTMTDGLLALESHPDAEEAMESIFRGAHSLKGMAGAMGYEVTAELTHKMESLMDAVRKGVRSADHALIDLMLSAVDTVREVISAESSDREAPDTAMVVDMLASAAAARSTDVVASSATAELALDEPLDAGERILAIEITLDEACVLKSVRAYMALKRLSMMGVVVETHPSAQKIEDEAFERTFTAVVRSRELDAAFPEALLAISEVSSVVVHERAVAAGGTAPVAPHAAEASHLAIPKLAETQTVRVSIGHLDNMVDLVGELVILSSRLEPVAERLQDRALDEVLEDLHRITDDLQHEVMLTRMVPVGNIFNRFPRMVRDLARDLGREVQFEMDGLDIELDRTVLDEIGDPLVHLLRNCIDHGIETPEERRSAGKPDGGWVQLSAVRDRDQVRITVADDGKGIDPDVVWAVAVERGLVDARQRSSMADEDILDLVCVPGFSTVQVATRVSGRGVGMDVVKGKIEHLGGTVRISSEPGRGSEFALTLPLTLAIIEALLCRVSEHVYAIPLTGVLEVLDPAEVRIETVDGRPVLVHRSGTVVALDRLDALLHGDRGGGVPRTGDSIVLLEQDDELRAVVVPVIVGRQQVVIKPLSPMFRAARGLGGATVLGDGTVALIVDTRGLFTAGEEHE